MVGVLVMVGVRVNVGVEDTPQMNIGDALLRGVSGFDVVKSEALLSESVHPLFKRTTLVVVPASAVGPVPS